MFQLQERLDSPRTLDEELKDLDETSSERYCSKVSAVGIVRNSYGKTLKDKIHITLYTLASIASKIYIVYRLL